MDLFGDEDIIYDDEPPEDDFGGAVSYAAAGESLSLPLLSDLCLGHEVIEKQFLDLYKKDKMPHAVVFSGAQGIGKTTFAFRLARFLLKHSKDSNSTQDALFASDDIVPDIQTMDVPKDDPVFSRIASGGHADLLHINKNESAGSAGNALKVEEVRTIEKFLRKTASEGGYRIVIIEDADMMTRSAQNAILKILEEPPEKVLMILVAHRSGMLIPTIRSRVRLFKFMPLSNEILLELLRKEEHSFTEKEQQRLLLFASGSIGKALSFCGDGGLEMLSEILTHLENTNKTQLHKFSQSLSAKGQEKSYYLFSEILQWMFRLMVSAKARGDNSIISAIQHDAVASMLSSYSLEKLLKISQNLKGHFQSVDFSNLDKRDAVRRAFHVLSD